MEAQLEEDSLPVGKNTGPDSAVFSVDLVKQMMNVIKIVTYFLLNLLVSSVIFQNKPS